MFSFYAYFVCFIIVVVIDFFLVLINLDLPELVRCAECGASTHQVQRTMADSLRDQYAGTPAFSLFFTYCFSFLFFGVLLFILSIKFNLARFPF
jgi:hypothetical protein